MGETSTTSPPRVQIVTDVTGWTEAQCSKLLGAINHVLESVDQTPAVTDPDHGWTKESLTQLLSRLAVGTGVVQGKAITTAIDHGGEVSREEVFEIGGYKPGRQLKGFTRPVNRIVKKMRDNGEIGEDAIDPFTPVYPVGTGYAQAQKFRVPACIVALWTE